MYGATSAIGVSNLTSNNEHSDIQAADLDVASLNSGESTLPFSNTNEEIKNPEQQRDQRPVLSPGGESFSQIKSFNFTISNLLDEEPLNIIELCTTCAQISIPEVQLAWEFNHKFPDEVLQTFHRGCRFCAILAIGFDLMLNINKTSSLREHRIKLRYGNGNLNAELGSQRSTLNLEEVSSKLND